MSKIDIKAMIKDLKKYLISMIKPLTNMNV